MHNYDHNGLEKTLNGFGYMHQLSEIAKKFIQFSKDSQGKLLDLGCAYGVTTIPCLTNGASVTACDIDAGHLEILKKRTPKEFLCKLETLHQRFPDQTEFSSNQFDGILLSHVLSFLKPQEIEAGLKKIFSWLKPGGKLFILNYTPYHQTLKDYIPVYEMKKKNGEQWPGLISNKDSYGDSSYLKTNLPNDLILFDPDTLNHVISEAGFVVDECDYLGSRTELVPEPFKMDGREWVGLIATKPK
jgi:SAM-dependent methyltransferase